MFTTCYDPYDARYEPQLTIALDEQEFLGFTTDLTWFDAARETR